MKKIILGLLVLAAITAVPSFAKSEDAKVVYDSEAIFMFSSGKPGSTHKITIDNNEYALDFTNQPTRTEFNAFVKSYEHYKMEKSMPVQVVGFIVKEKGHMPNPEAVMNVFKLMSMTNYSIPKGLEK